MAVEVVLLEWLFCTSVMKYLSLWSDRDDEPTHLPPAPDIVHQFSNRQVWVSCTDPSEDRLQAHYWFPIDVLEDDDEQETERVS